MDQNVLIANIGGVVFFAIGAILYAVTVVKDGELPFFGWRTTVGFMICIIGCVFALITSGVLK